MTYVDVHVWEDDPGAPPPVLSPITRPMPDLQNSKPRVKIDDRVPGTFDSSDYALRYWSAADALRRSCDWATEATSEFPLSWHRSIGRELTAYLDTGERLNALYTRGHGLPAGIHFYHGSSGNQSVYSCESPDMVSHETGHAILDAINARLWNVADPEVMAFHEAFGDISAVLSAVRVDSFCTSVIFETDGKLNHSSRLSRVAEQLAWAVRRVRPHSVEQTCTRDLANEFFYRDPYSLPPRAPTSQLCNEPHSFSRVFSAAFLDALEAMFYPKTVADLQDVAKDVGKLLVTAALATPVSYHYYADLAAHMIAVDVMRYDGQNGLALRGAFARRGILSPSQNSKLSSDLLNAKIAEISTSGDSNPPDLQMIIIPGSRYGLSEDFEIPIPSESPRFAELFDEAPAGSQREELAYTYVDSLFSQGQIYVSKDLLTDKSLASERTGAHTHEISHSLEDGQIGLNRVAFEHAPPPPRICP
ncbi:hypothetical protein [Streptomyces sp. NPDC046832]|uniref:hypothetical protein n=1 Tax=Streptomyces sp. NPDC046832 TaxID=3155020 RepID=UPI0033D7C2FB